MPRSDFSEIIDVFAKGPEDCLGSGALTIESKILNDTTAVKVSLKTTNLRRKN